MDRCSRGGTTSTAATSTGKRTRSSGDSRNSSPGTSSAVYLDAIAQANRNQAVEILGNCGYHGVSSAIAASLSTKSSGDLSAAASLGPSAAVATTSDTTLSAVLANVPTNVPVAAAKGVAERPPWVHWSKADMAPQLHLEQQETYTQVSQQTEAKHSCQDHSCDMPDVCTLEDTLICSKQLQDGRVPESIQHFAATKVDISNLGNVRKSSEAEQCASMSTPTIAAILHQQSQDAAVISTWTASSRPSRPLVLPTSAEDSVRRHYVSPKLQATANRLIANSIVNSLSQQSNVVNNARSAQPEDLLVAVPVEEDEVHGYAVSHDVSQDELHKKVQMVRVRRISCRLYFIVFLVLAAAAMITSIVVIKKNKNDGQEQEIETEMTLSQNMTQLIVSIMGADAVLLNDMSSPYAKALTWLLQSNKRNKSQEMTSTLAQRFYAACFYFDTTADDDKWADCNPPNSSSEHDPTCFDVYSNTTAKAWLSDSHECEWAGVLCDNHQQMIRLGLDNMNLVGTIPSCTAKFPFLYYLWLTSSRLGGNIPLLSHYHHLSIIDFDNNSLSGDLSSVWQHRKLTVFGANFNHISGSLSSQIGGFIDLKLLSLYNNDLTGTVPSEIGWLDSITSFDIGNNHFRGELPQSMRLWSMIKYFYVPWNSFSGLIPTFFGQFNTTLSILELYDNNFTGTLPDELFHLGELITLDVSNNNLSGTLDARFAQLTSLQRKTTINILGLSGNHFSGTIPTELGLLTDLVVIYLQGNDFHGSVPASLCQNKLLFPSYFDLVANCAEDDSGQVELQCDCCTFCCQADGTHCESK